MSRRRRAWLAVGMAAQKAFERLFNPVNGVKKNEKIERFEGFRPQIRIPHQKLYRFQTPPSKEKVFQKIYFFQISRIDFPNFWSLDA